MPEPPNPQQVIAALATARDVIVWVVDMLFKATWRLALGFVAMGVSAKYLAAWPLFSRAFVVLGVGMSAAMLGTAVDAWFRRVVSGVARPRRATERKVRVQIESEAPDSNPAHDAQTSSKEVTAEHGRPSGGEGLGSDAR